MNEKHLIWWVEKNKKRILKSKDRFCVTFTRKDMFDILKPYPYYEDLFMLPILLCELIIEVYLEKYKWSDVRSIIPDVARFSVLEDYTKRFPSEIEEEIYAKYEFSNRKDR